jgi:hypothetical protein
MRQVSGKITRVIQPVLGTRFEVRHPTPSGRSPNQLLDVVVVQAAVDSSRSHHQDLILSNWNVVVLGAAEHPSSG